LSVLRARPARGPLLALLAWLALAAPTRADEAAAWAALRQGGVVALMRHGEAPGVGDPPGWRLSDCPSQRNLSERGRAEARAVGARLRSEGIAIGRVVSSPWCRCLDTATLVDAGAVEVEPTFAKVLTVLLEGVSLGALQYEPAAPATGYLAFLALALYLVGLFLLRAPHPQELVRGSRTVDATAVVRLLVLCAVAGTLACARLTL